MPDPEYFTFHLHGGHDDGLTFPWDDSQDPNDLPQFWIQGGPGWKDIFTLRNYVGWDVHYWLEPTGETPPNGEFKPYNGLKGVHPQ